MLLKNTQIPKWFVFSLIYFLAALNLFSQDLKFKRFNRNEGLSSVNVKTIFQDSKDFIWIGTQDGLNRFDGYHFKIFKSNINDKNALLSADINCITEDSNHLIYIGTNGSGLSEYNMITETFKNFTNEKNNICNNNILCLLNLNQTDLLIGTEDGLSVFNKKTKRAYKISSDFISANERLYISSIYKDDKGIIWVAIPKFGLYEFDLNEKKLIHHPFNDDILKSEKQYQDHAIMSLVQSNDNLYCATFSGGIIVYNLRTHTFDKRISFLDINPDLNSTRNIIADKNSNCLWIASLGGLIRYDLYSHSYKITTHNVLDNTSIPSNEILCILQDKQHNIWLGSEDNGISVNFKSSQNFTHYNKHQLKGNDVVYCFLETHDSLIWIGTDDGLFTFNKSNKEFTNQSDIIKKHNASSVWSLLQDSNHNLWIGTEGSGIIFYDYKTKNSKLILNPQYFQGIVLKMVEEGNTVWASTYNYGLLKIDKTNFNLTSFNTENKLTTNTIKDIYKNASDQSYWLSTQDGGINVLKFNPNGTILNNKTYTHQNNKNSISSDLVYSIYKTTDHTFWIAANNGLNKLRNDTFTVYTEDDGLPNNCIYTILPDNEGQLWLTTNNGLSCYNPKTHKFINYNTSNGIQSKEFNQGAAYKCKDGNILVGGMNGFNYFNPKNIKADSYKPRLYIYSYNKQGKEVATDTSILLKKHINLTYKDNYFTFEVVALDYTSPENIKYMYILEGYDQSWSSPSSIRYISYTELPGGNYTLKIKATNSTGVWNEIPLEITIKVTPPWYKTTWFYIISLLTISGSVIGFFTYRTNAIKKENKILENKVSERTRELAEKNRDITSSIEYAKRIQEAILPSKDLIFSRLKQVFILYKPKDIVSGDFYWFGEKDNLKIIAVVDCTGHGVPGAFMSMIGHNLLNQIVSEKGFSDPGAILNELHKGVQSALKQGHNDVNTNDGMDVSILALNTETKECFWAGAFRSLVIVNNEGELEKLDGNKYPVGGAQLDSERIFTTHSVKLNKNDCLYMFTDGYADQFGGSKGKKFMVKQFHDNLRSVHQYSITEQKKELESQFNNWKGEFEQVDDVLVIGIKL
jgi:ligand-binding sensor domain-containing protein/serine phosphatase RsbU (regulator of sigma subunit)